LGLGKTGCGGSVRACRCLRFQDRPTMRIAVRNAETISNPILLSHFGLVDTFGSRHQLEIKLVDSVPGRILARGSLQPGLFTIFYYNQMRRLLSKRECQPEQVSR
jgi:hypothetical protein